MRWNSIFESYKSSIDSSNNSTLVLAEHVESAKKKQAKKMWSRALTNICCTIYQLSWSRFSGRRNHLVAPRLILENNQVIFTRIWRDFTLTITIGCHRSFYPPGSSLEKLYGPWRMLVIWLRSWDRFTHFVLSFNLVVIFLSLDKTLWCIEK